MSDRLIIDIGSSAGAGDGDDLRVAFDKTNKNFANIWAGNVTTAANNLVYSVAGRQGNVTLTWLDVAGVATLGNVTELKQYITSNTAAANAYTDSAIGNLTSIANIAITGGTLGNVRLTGNSWGNVANLTVGGNQTILGSLIIDGGLSVNGNFVLGGNVTVDTITFGDGSSMNTVVNLTPLNSAVNALRANLTAANAAILINTNRVAAANAAITLANADIVTLYANAASQNLAIIALQGANSIQSAKLDSLLTTNNAQTIQINELRANITAANATIDSHYAIHTSNAASQAVAINSLNANVSAANVAIASLNASSGLTAANAAIAALQANIAAANVAIITLDSVTTANAITQATLLNTLTANSVTQAQQIASLNANLSAANAQIAAANLTIANVQIAALRANVEAANAAIAAVTVAWTANAAAQATTLSTLTSNASSQAVAITNLIANDVVQHNSIQSLQANVAAANAAIANITLPDLSGNVIMGNVQAYHGNFSVVSGTILTAAQPNITTVGTLDDLDVDGNITADRLTSSQIFGPLRTASQPNITAVGNLTSLTVVGNISSGNVSGATGAFTNLTGTLLTPAQTNITSVGTLGTIAVSGNATVGNLNTSGNVSAFRMTASDGFVGNILTTAQTAITRVGTLVNLSVTGNTTAGNLTTAGTLRAGNVEGTVLTAAQPNITTLGNLTNLEIAGNLIVFGNVSTIQAANVAFGKVFTSNLTALTLVSDDIRGPINTGTQPNIVSVGTLNGLNVNGQARADTVVSNSSVTAVTLLGNLVATNAFVSSTLLVGNINATTDITTGNVNAGNLNITGNLFSTGTGSYVHADIGDFSTLNGLLYINSQPYITSVGILTELRVNGPVEISGSQFVAQDFYVTGNLFVNGNTTTVSAGNVTTSDLDLTLANGAVSATAARGSGILIGQGGAFGNLTIYDGVWTTPNAFAIAGNVNAGNVTATQGTFNIVAGTLQTAAQPNITSVGVLNSVTTSGAILGANIDVVGTTTLDLNATNANLGVVRSASHVFAQGNVLGTVGEFTGLVGSLRTSLQPNITQIGTLANLTITGNLDTGNVSAVTGAFTSLVGTLLTPVQTNITSVGTLGNLDVAGTITANAFTFASIGASFTISNLVVTDFGTINTLIGNSATFGNITGTLLTNSQPNITSVGTLDALSVTGNVSTGNVSGATGTFTDVTVSDALAVLGNAAVGNITANTGTFTNVVGTLLTNSQPFITEIGTLPSLTVTGNISSGNISGNTGSFANVTTVQLNADQATFTANVSTGNVSGSTGTFSNIVGTLVTTAQTNITSIGNLSSLIVTGNVTSANISTFKGSFSQVEGTLLTNAQPFITSVGTLGNLTVSGLITGNISATLFQDGFLTQAIQPNITQVGQLSSLTSTGNITTFGWVISPIVKTNSIEGSVVTPSQTAITTVGNLTSLEVASNISTIGNVISSATVYAQDVVVGNNISANSITVAAGNIVVSNAIVNDSITVAGNVLAGNINANSTLTTTNLTVNGVGVIVGNTSIGNLEINNNLVVSNGNVVALAANLFVSAANITSNLTANVVRITSTTDSFSPLEGALLVAGGVGIGGNIAVLGNVISNESGYFASNLFTFGNAHIGGDIYFNSSQTSVDFKSNVGNISLFSSNVTVIEIGGEATTVNIGALSGFGNTTIRNDLTVNGGLFLTGGWGEVGIGNVYINHDLTVANDLFANSLLANGSITANGSVTANGSGTFNGSITANGDITGTGNITANGSLTGITSITALSASIANSVVIGDRLVLGNTFANAHTIGNANINSGALQVRGGASFQSNVIIGKAVWDTDPVRSTRSEWAGLASNANVYINSTTPTFNSNTGALRVLGGISTAGNLWVNGDATIVGNVNFTAFLAASINNTPIGNATPSSGVFTTIGMGNVRPAKRPTMNFDFGNSSELPMILTFSRTSTATYFTKTGILKLASADEPRFTYDPSNLTPMGIMIEESRQNLLRESNSFANSTVYFTLNGNVDTVSNATTSPDSLYNAFKITGDTSNSIHGIYQDATYHPTLGIGQEVVASAFVKAAELDQATLIFENEGSPTIFDLTNGTVDTEGPSYRSSIQTLANGWYRIQSTVTKTNTSGNILLALADSGSEQFWANGQGIYGFGLQMEFGDFATSYVPTTTVANTRSADSLTVNNFDFARLYDYSASTVFVDAALDYRPTTAVNNNRRSTFVSFNDGTVNNRITVLAENKNAPVDRTANLIIYSGGVLQTNTSILTANVATANLNTGTDKIAVYFKKNMIGRAFNNIANVFVTTGNIPQSVSRIEFGTGPGTNSLNGTIRKIQIYPGIVDGNELRTLSINKSEGTF